MAAESKNKKGKIIAIANQKGGVGKTTTTINLSAALAAKKQDVLLIDLDPQGNATSGLGIEKNLEPSIYNVMIEEIGAEEAITKTEYDHLKVIPGTIQLAGAEVELVGMLAREQILKSALEPLRGEYDFILIDCPPSLGLLTLNALTAADSVLVPIQCEYFALEGLSQLMNTFTMVKKKLNPQIEIEGVVLTMFDGRTRLSNQVVAEVKKFFNSKVYRSVIPRTVRLGEAPSYGQPILQYAPISAGARAYRLLADEVLKDNGG